MVEDGLVDSRDPTLKDRIRALVDLRDTAEAEADRAAAAAEKLGPVINPKILVRFAAATRDMLRNEDGSSRRNLLRAVAQRVEITSTTSATMMGSKIELLRTLASNDGVETAVLDVRSLAPEWRHLLDMRENYFYDIAPVRTPRRDKGCKRPKRSDDLPGAATVGTTKPKTRRRS